MRWSLLSIILGINLLACEGGSSFLSGQQDKSIEASKQASPGASEAVSESFPAEQVEISSEESLPMTELVDLAPDEQTALDECLVQWTDHPFSADQAMRPSVSRIETNIGNSQILYTDNLKSVAPHLKLLVVDIRIGNQSQIDLLDRHAWTCLYFKGKVTNGFGINQICDSRLAIVSFNAQNANNFYINEVCPAP